MGHAITVATMEVKMLSIPLETVAWIVLKAREFDVKDVGAHGTEDDEDNPLGVLQDRADDPTFLELNTWINDLTETQQAELVALFWLGRDGGDEEEFRNLLAEARGQQTGDRTARYLLGSPMLGDHIESGLEQLGYDTSELESSVT